MLGCIPPGDHAGEYPKTQPQMTVNETGRGLSVDLFSLLSPAEKEKSASPLA